MKLKSLATGSSGNCYLLTSDDGETLIIDCGIPIKEIKKGLNWEILNVAGCIVSHGHKDHSRSINELCNMGIKVFAPYQNLDEMGADEKTMLVEEIGCFKITAFQVPHNGTRNCGFLISADGERILYMTDLEYCPYNFAKTKINHMLIECNYIKDMIDRNLPNYVHKVKGHCELETTKGIVATNNSNSLRTVILCHMGAETCDNDRIVKEVKEITPQATVMCAGKNLEIELRKDICPFY